MSHPRPRNRTPIMLAASMLAFAGALAAAPTAGAAVGDLAQLPGLDACVSDDGSSGLCADGSALLDGKSVAISPDGTSAYVAAESSDAVAVFDRDPVTGALTQKPGTAGCVSDSGSGGACTDGVALDGPRQVAVSGDGQNLYVVSRFSDAVAVFDRDPASGAIAQKPGAAGCISDGGGDCADGEAVLGANSIVLSPDGESAYVAAASIGVAVFDRNPGNGELTQKSGVAGCFTPDGSGSNGDPGLCGSTSNISPAPRAVVVSPGGDNVYFAGGSPGGGGSLVAFARNPHTGALTRKPGTAGCVTRTGSGGSCGVAPQLFRAESLAVSPDGRQLYLSSQGGDSVTVIDRSVATGAIAPKAGTAGCITESGSSGACTDGLAITQPESIVVAPGGSEVYVASGNGIGGPALQGGFARFERDPGTGELTQPAGTAGCALDSEDGPGNCAPAVATAIAAGLALSPDGASLYVATASGVAAFDRQATPETAIDSGPSGVTADNTPTFAFSSDTSNAGFECSLDGQPFQGCSASTTTFALAEGPHELEVRALDPFGNADPTPASAAFTVDSGSGNPAPDTTAPDTELGSEPAPRIARRGKRVSLRFAFEGSEPGASFRCRFGAGDWVTCTSPYVVRVKLPRKARVHSFRVAAVDAAGNADFSPAKWTGTLQRKRASKGGAK